MAIIDRNSILFEGSLTADTTGPAVALNALRLPGRMEPMPLLEESDSAGGPWTAVPGASVTVSHSAENPALAAGARPYHRFLPQGVRKSWLRLTLGLTVVSGKNASQGRIFAALTREEDLPYEAALMAGR